MIDPGVIERIVEEIVNKLANENMMKRQKLLVVSKPNINTEQDCSFLNFYWSIVKANQQDDNLMFQVDHAAFLSVDQDFLAKVALGFTDCLESKLFSHLIIHEIPITFVLEPRLQKLLQVDEKKHKYPYYLKTIHSYKETIEKYGVAFKELKDLKPFNIEKNSTITKTLVTQDDIINYSGERLVVQQGTIITPLARDKARERGIEISFS